jgi:hypothetical protein
VNTRSRLSPSWSERLAYPGSCFSASALVVSVPEIAKVDEKERLTVMASKYKEEYTKQKAYPSLLAACPQAVDMLIAGMKAQP